MQERTSDETDLKQEGLLLEDVADLSLDLLAGQPFVQHLSPEFKI